MATSHSIPIINPTTLEVVDPTSDVHFLSIAPLGDERLSLPAMTVWSAIIHHHDAKPAPTFCVERGLTRPMVRLGLFELEKAGHLTLAKDGSK